jgi:ADP-ribose pyrophosphatase YjhB (NUDIX family)
LIRPIAICIFRHGNQVLVFDGLDSVTNSRFARPLGGGIEDGETSAQALVREIREEISQEITGLQLLGVLENIFTYEGKPGHEIVFVYTAAFANPHLYSLPSIPMAEAGWISPALWRSLDSFGPHYPLYPLGLMELIANSPRRPSSSPT